jgi:ComF family protein
VVALKYHGRHRTAERLAIRLLGDARCRGVLEEADTLVGVPLHRDRERERGFNQAGLIARALARARSIPVSQELVRGRDTRSQTDLSARDRRVNVRNAFAVRSDRPFKNAVVVLIDDVTTTGATLRECALTLLAHGAREVRAITVARAE